MSKNFDSNWDIEKYKSPFESEEHWQLRKNFLVCHKDKYPEDKLICLAQVFFNVEMLGCKYPDETMALVSELSEGIADEYREKKQQKIQRTFVKASDAAEAKFKGLSFSKSATVSDMTEPKSAINPIKPIDERYENIISHHVIDLIRTEKVEALLRDVVILKTVEENFFEHGSMIVQNSFAKKRLKPDYAFSEQSEGDEKLWQCTLSIQGCYLANAVTKSKPVSKRAVNDIFLHALQEMCYTLEQKTKFLGDGSVIDKNVEQVDTTKEQPELSNANIGSKMMRLMGWKGGGLGKSEQGIAEPIMLENCIKKSGLGANLSHGQLMKCLNKKIADFARMETNYDLVFSHDFSKDERARIHSIADKFHLRSRSYGSGNKRHIVVSKQAQQFSIVTTLLSCGGENERYKLIPPFNEAYK